MLKIYNYNGCQYWFEEGKQPAEATEYIPAAKAAPVEAEAPAEKAQPAPRNKARKAVANK